MNTSKRTINYRDLSSLTQEEWKSLDIYIFIAENFNRYCSILIKKIGMQYLPSDTRDSLMGIFCDVGHRPLTRAHAQNLNATGERRNQIMLGTLKMIATTRMVEAVIKEYPSYVTLNAATDPVDSDDWTDCPTESFQQTPATHQPAFYAAENSCTFWNELEDQTQEDAELSLRMEVLRSYLTPLQFKHLRYTICDGLSTNEIAEKTGHSATNVRIMLLNARKIMLDLVPEHLQQGIQHCIRRR
ncbi:MAG: hypothetical protein COA99_03720 [Moraxellaceae bacterium]|nr:MAG: hypothetical protein COA99_03720 [Moraxellaceae bacterium]